MTLHPHIKGGSCAPAPLLGGIVTASCESGNGLRPEIRSDATRPNGYVVHQPLLELLAMTQCSPERLSRWLGTALPDFQRLADLWLSIGRPVTGFWRACWVCMDDLSYVDGATPPNAKVEPLPPDGDRGRH